MTKIICEVQVKRVGDNESASLGVIYLDGVAFCGSVEDQEQKGKKVPKETRVSDGVYKLGLRKAGRHYNEYVPRFNMPTGKNYQGENWYRGTPCVYTEINGESWDLKCPDGKKFSQIMIHIGNYEHDTDGCLLPNYRLDFKHDQGGGSTAAFIDLYPILRDSIEASEKGWIPIVYMDVEEGK